MRRNGMTWGWVLGCALALGAASVARAESFLELEPESTGPHAAYSAASTFATTSDGVAGTTGNQDVSGDYLNFLDSIASFSGGSFTVSGLTASGPPTVFSTFVSQNLTGGSFSLYNSSNTLLLSGTLGTSLLSGLSGPGGVASVTSGATVTGGTLQPLIAPGSLSISISITDINDGAGFTLSSGNTIIDPFSGDMMVTFAGNEAVPEPSTAALLIAGVMGSMIVRRKRR